MPDVRPGRATPFTPEGSFRANAVSAPAGPKSCRRAAQPGGCGPWPVGHNGATRRGKDGAADQHCSPDPRLSGRGFRFVFEKDPGVCSDDLAGLSRNQPRRVRNNARNCRDGGASQPSPSTSAGSPERPNVGRVLYRAPPAQCRELSASRRPSVVADRVQVGRLLPGHQNG